TGSERSGKANRAYQRVLHERFSDFDSGIEDKRKNSSRQAAGFGACRNHTRRNFARSRMRGVRFHHNWIACGEGRGGVAPGNRERDGEIARAKNGNWSNGAKHGAKVRPRQRLPVGQSRINAGSNPGALLDQVGEKPELIGRTLDLALKAGLRWERRLQLPTRGKLGGGGIDAVRNRAQESRSLAARSAPVCRECLVRSLRRRIDVGNAGRGELRFKPLST